MMNEKLKYAGLLLATMLVCPLTAQEMEPLDEDTEPDLPYETGSEVFDAETGDSPMAEFESGMEEGVWHMPQFCDSLPEGRYNGSWDHFVVNPYDLNLMNMTDV